MASSALDLRLSDLVREAADRHGISQAELAPTLGLTRQALGHRLNGISRWTLTEARAVAEVLDLDLDALLDSASDGGEVLAS